MRIFHFSHFKPFLWSFFALERQISLSKNPQAVFTVFLLPDSAQYSFSTVSYFEFLTRFSRRFQSLISDANTGNPITVYLHAKKLAISRLGCVKSGTQDRHQFCIFRHFQNITQKANSTNFNFFFQFFISFVFGLWKFSIFRIFSGDYLEEKFVRERIKRYLRPVGSEDAIFRLYRIIRRRMRGGSRWEDTDLK